MWANKTSDKLLEKCDNHKKKNEKQVYKHEHSEYHLKKSYSMSNPTGNIIYIQCIDCMGWSTNAPPTNTFTSHINLSKMQPQLNLQIYWFT